ncbi:MAG: PadR family transcriptional regulator [Actinomycetota bacterium]
MASQTQAMLNLNETALLGLLADKARYGYELDKIIKEKYMREWTDIAFSSIYAILKALEDKGCLVSSAEIAGNRVRRHYSITRQGRKILRGSTMNLLSEPSKTSDSLMAGLANMSLLSDEDIKQALARRAGTLKTQLSYIDEVGKDRRGKDKAYFEALVVRTKGRVAGELSFVEEFLGAASERKPSKEATVESAKEAGPEVSPVPPLTETMTEAKSKASIKVEKEDRKETLF